MAATARSYPGIAAVPARAREATIPIWRGRVARLDTRLLQIGFLGILLAAGLLRSDNLVAHPAASAIAISSKFIIRCRGKHIFNPANLGVVLALLALPGTWVSSGQWGADVAFAAWLLILGNLVVNRARRADISWSFLLIYMSALGLRVLWLGQQFAVWTHQLSNGALLLFAFFMISDPMTSPNHPRARVLHAGVVALLSYLWQFGFYRTNGFIWALFAAAPLVPIWDLLWLAPRFQWTSRFLQASASDQCTAGLLIPPPDQGEERWGLPEIPF